MPAARHGTLVASLVFGRGTVAGVAPGCRGLAVEVFGGDTRPTSSPVCSQAILAEAVERAVDAGAHVINISAGEVQRTGLEDARLLAAVRTAVDRGVLVVAATGDGGCADPQVPSRLPQVLGVAVGGAAPSRGWAPAASCLTAAGVGVPGALPGGGLTTGTGSSYACALVAGTAALLLSLQLRLDGVCDPLLVGRLLEESARRTAEGLELDLTAAVAHLLQSSGKGRPGPAPVPPPPRGLAAEQPLQVSDWALRTRFRAVARSDFGSVTVLAPDGSSYRVADLGYPLEDGQRGLRLVPASDEARVVFPDGTEGPGWQQVDDLLRERSGIGADDPVFALLSYIHPEEHVVDVAAMPGTTKLYLGHRHVGAYQGRGRTTHALSARSNWRGRAPSDMGFNVDRHPANVQLLSMRGVPQATLNRNAVIVDRIVAARAAMPVAADSIEARPIDLNTTLQYYRDLLCGAEYLEDLSWFTNCSVQKMIVVNVLLNVPHNAAAFSKIFGEDGEEVWQRFRDCYVEAFGSPFTREAETWFTPLWRLEGLPVTAVRPLSLREYLRYYAAVDEHRLAEYSGRRPLPPGEGLAWAPETLVDVLGTFIDTYVRPEHLGWLACAGELVLLRHVVRERARTDSASYLDTVAPLVARFLAADALGHAESAAEVDEWRESAALRLQEWLARGDALNPPARDADLLESVVDGCVDTAAHLAREQLERGEDGRLGDEASADWLRAALAPELARARGAAVASRGAEVSSPVPPSSTSSGSGRTGPAPSSRSAPSAR